MKAASTSQPVYLLAGGPGSRRTGPDPLLQLVFSDIGKPSPLIAYIGAASGDNPDFFKWLSTHFKNSGAGEVTLAAMASVRANPAKTLALLEKADLVFISGGDVEEGMSLLEKRSMIPLLHRLYKAGKPFFGLSAGSIMLAKSWVRWADPDDDRTAKPFNCLGFVPILCDMHAESDDWAELKVLLQLQPEGAIGFGIPSNTALRMHPNGTLTPIGGEIVRFQWQGHEVKKLTPLRN